MLKYLENYPLKDVAKELSEGLQYGFRLHYTGPRIHRESVNLKSAFQQKGELIAKVEKEIKLGRIAGPFKTLPISNLQVSPVGVVLKSDGKSWRLITHLSFPEGVGVNNFIDPDLCSVRYTSFDKVVEMISRLGKRADLGVIDIKSAFSLLPVHPGDFDLLGFKIDHEYYIQKMLPMGCSISPKTFNEFSSFLHWLVEKISGMSSLDHYLDDFIFAGEEHTKSCQKLMDCFLEICRTLSVPIAPEKLIGPVKVLTFLGLVIDTEEMLIKIPEEKVKALIAELEHYLKQERITLKNLQSLVGSLNFFSRAIPSARAFNRRFYDLTVKAKKPYHFIKISLEVKEDMRIWLYFLHNFNGKVFFPESVWSSNDTLQLWTDSSGSEKCGGAAYFNGAWLFFPWPREWVDLGLLRDMTFLEFIPILLAISVWGKKLQNKRIKLYVDNQSLVEVLNSQTSRSKRVMTLMRTFVLYALQNNIIFKSHHLYSHDNSIADAISRQQWDRFRRLAPQADVNPTPIPDHIQQLIYNMKLKD